MCPLLLTSNDPFSYLSHSPQKLCVQMFHCKLIWCKLTPKELKLLCRYMCWCDWRCRLQVVNWSKSDGSKSFELLWLIYLLIHLSHIIQPPNGIDLLQINMRKKQNSNKWILRRWLNHISSSLEVWETCILHKFYKVLSQKLCNEIFGWMNKIWMKIS